MRSLSAAAAVVLSALLVSGVCTRRQQAEAVERLRRRARNASSPHTGRAALPGARAVGGAEELRALAALLAGVAASDDEPDPQRAPDEGSAADDPPTLAELARRIGSASAQAPEGRVVGLAAMAERLSALRDKHRAGLLPHAGPLIDWEDVELLLQAHAAPGAARPERAGGPGAPSIHARSPSPFSGWPPLLELKMARFFPNGYPESTCRPRLPPAARSMQKAEPSSRPFWWGGVAAFCAAGFAFLSCILNLVYLSGTAFPNTKSPFRERTQGTFKRWSSLEPELLRSLWDYRVVSANLNIGASALITLAFFFLLAAVMALADAFEVHGGPGAHRAAKSLLVPSFIFAAVLAMVDLAFNAGAVTTAAWIYDRFTIDDTQVRPAPRSQHGSPPAAPRAPRA